MTTPLQMLIMMFAGWVNEHQRTVIAYLQEEHWSYTRIVGELAKVGHHVSRSTVRRILREHGVGPAPERLPHMPWSKFLKAHWQAIAAADFPTVEVWTAVGLVRYLVFFVLDLAARRMEIAAGAALGIDTCAWPGPRVATRARRRIDIPDLSGLATVLDDVRARRRTGTHGDLTIHGREERRGT